MTDIASALNATGLGEFEGALILSTGIEIPNAAGGLRESLKIDPLIMHKDDERLVLLRTTVGKIRFDPIKDSEGVTRIHVLTTTEATIVEGDVFEQALKLQAEKIQLAREEAEGTQRLPFDEELAAIHEQGGHDGGLVTGCPGCDAEAEAAWNEAAAKVEAEDNPSEG